MLSKFPTLVKNVHALREAICPCPSNEPLLTGISQLPSFHQASFMHFLQSFPKLIVYPVSLEMKIVLHVMQDANFGVNLPAHPEQSQIQILTASQNVIYFAKASVLWFDFTLNHLTRSIE